MLKPQALVPIAAFLVVVPTLVGCNTPSMADLRRIESEIANLRARLDAAEGHATANAASSDSALDSAVQCNQVCLRVSEQLDQLLLQTTPR
jgi:regulator of extracellular matrix RemA (YlzA/DUF370 family)